MTESMHACQGGGLAQPLSHKCRLRVEQAGGLNARLGKQSLTPYADPAGLGLCKGPLWVQPLLGTSALRGPTLLEASGVTQQVETG